MRLDLKCTSGCILDECIALWRMIEWQRQWHSMYKTIVGIGMVTNTMILCHLLYLERVEYPALQQSL